MVYPSPRFACVFTTIDEEKNMPRRPNKPCAHPGCAKLIPPTEMYCEQHVPLHKVKEDPSRYSTARGYDSRWMKARLAYLESHPLCVECEKEGRYVKATVVDHIIPHRGNQRLFWDVDNWQPLCKHHHDVKTKTIDRKYIETHPWEGHGA